MQLINQLFRRVCCWNCFQIGHLRFQCPFPRAIRCSFCRKPFVLSTDCNCRYQNSLNVSEHQYKRSSKRTHKKKSSLSKSDLRSKYNENVVVPIHASNGEIYPVEVDNLVVFVENEKIDERMDIKENEDMDILEIHAETESLENL